MAIGPGYDANQVIEASFDDTAKALNVQSIGGALVPDIYNEIDLTYVPTGNGVGQIQTVTYKLQNVIIAILTLSYDASARLTGVVRS